MGILCLCLKCLIFMWSGEVILEFLPQRWKLNYFFFSKGVWGIGVANRSINLNSVPISANSWVLRHTGEVVANGEVVDKLLEPIEEGDCIVGFTRCLIKRMESRFWSCAFSILDPKHCVVPFKVLGIYTVAQVSTHLLWRFLYDQIFRQIYSS